MPTSVPSKSEKYIVEVDPSRTVELYLEPARRPPTDGRVAAAQTLDRDQDHVITSADLKAGSPEDLGRLFGALTSRLHSEQPRWEQLRNERIGTQALAVILGSSLAASAGPVLGAAVGAGVSAAFRKFDRESEEDMAALMAAANLVGAHLEPPRAVAVKGMSGAKLPLDSMRSPNRVIVFNPEETAQLPPGTHRSIEDYRSAFDKATTPSWLARQASAGPWDWGWAGPLNLTVFPLILLAAAGERVLRGREGSGVLGEQDAHALRRLYEAAPKEAQAWIREDLSEVLAGHRRQSFETVDSTVSYTVQIDEDARKILESIVAASPRAA